MKRFFFSIYFFLIAAVSLTIVGMGYVADFYIQYKYPGRYTLEERNMSKGTYYLLEQELLKVEEERYQRVIDGLQPQFGYPIELHNLDSLPPNSRKKEVLTAGKIFLDEEGVYHSKRIGMSETFLRMGPFQYMNLKPSEITGLIVVTALTLGVLVLLWASYFWGNLNRIKAATSAFGEGNFSARVKIPQYSSLKNIASAFNDMAAQIERLISSHKQLVNAVAHELRTPISRIRFGIESLRTGGEEERVRYLSGIRNDVDELDDLVSELLSYSRFERMENRMNLQNHPLLPWLREYVKAAQEFIKVPLEFSWQNIDEETLVAFDPRQLERAVHNLLQNSSRFASRLVDIKICREINGVEIRIEDDGPGIKTEDRERVFAPFVRLDSSRNREDGGYGLGLSIVREIVRGHHATIAIEDSPHGGAAFCITLPA